MKLMRPILVLTTLCIALIGSAQEVGIRTNDPKAILDVSGTTSGVLMPRMDSTTRVGLTVGANQDGMQVYDTDSKTVWYYNHNIPKWLEIKSSNDKFIDGNNTSDAVYTIGNVGIGTVTPSEQLEIAGNIQSDDTLKSSVLLIDDPQFASPVATGGNTITTSGGYTIHTFTSSGTFTPNGNTAIEYLVVGGGGGGGNNTSGWGGGGGGGGGFRTGSTTISDVPTAITVGAGGVYANGGNSSIGTAIVSLGGGHGGENRSNATNIIGLDGGSGGGSGHYYNGTNYVGAAGGSGTAGQGHNGGSNNSSNSGISSGGGGGAGAAGQNGFGNGGGGTGGAGLSSDITGTTVWYAGGGGSRKNSSTNAPGGIGGGGNGNQSGTPNTGGGGGGGGHGGSGIVIVRYPTTNPHSEIITTVGTNVGFGTPTPTARLSVNGDANKPGGGSWAVFSDERSKEAITDYTKGTKELLEIEPKSFQYKEAFGWGTNTHIGLIAQEVEAVVPSMVTTKEVQHIKDFREVDPNELNYMLINAVKELDAKTKALNEAIRQAEQDADAGLEQLRAQAEELKQLKKVLEKHGIHTQGSVVRSTTK